MNILASRGGNGFDIMDILTGDIEAPLPNVRESTETNEMLLRRKTDMEIDVEVCSTCLHRANIDLGLWPLSYLMKAKVHPIRAKQ